MKLLGARAILYKVKRLVATTFIGLLFLLSTSFDVLWLAFANFSPLTWVKVPGAVMHSSRTHPIEGGKTFSVSSTRLWNSLPIDLKKGTCVTSFRKALYSHFLTRYNDVDHFSLSETLFYFLVLC